MRRRLASLVFLLLLPLAANAVTGGKPARDRDGLRRSVVWVESSIGDLCSGVLVAPNVVLTAAHCLVVPARYRVIMLNSRFEPIIISIVSSKQYGNFITGQPPEQQSGSDIALAKLAYDVPADMQPATLADMDIRPGTDLYLAGFGSTSYDNEKSARTLRIARLTGIAYRQQPNGIIFAADPKSLGRTAGAGACRGDSGGPVFVDTGHGYAVGGLVSWSARARFARNNSPCGGFTAITPITPHVDWINREARRLSGRRQST